MNQQFQTPPWACKPADGFRLEAVVKPGAPALLARTIPLARPVTTLGRLQQFADVELGDHATISRRHAAIAAGAPPPAAAAAAAAAGPDGGPPPPASGPWQASVIDLGSANGTYLKPAGEGAAAGAGGGGGWRRLEPHAWCALGAGDALRFGESPVAYAVAGLAPAPRAVDPAARRAALANLAVYSDSDSEQGRKKKGEGGRGGGAGAGGGSAGGEEAEGEEGRGGTPGPAGRDGRERRDGYDDRRKGEDRRQDWRRGSTSGSQEHRSRDRSRDRRGSRSRERSWDRRRGGSRSRERSWDRSRDQRRGSRSRERSWDRSWDRRRSSRSRDRAGDRSWDCERDRGQRRRDWDRGQGGRGREGGRQAWGDRHEDRGEDRRRSWGRERRQGDQRNWRDDERQDSRRREQSWDRREDGRWREQQQQQPQVGGAGRLEATRALLTEWVGGDAAATAAQSSEANVEAVKQKLIAACAKVSEDKKKGQEAISQKRKMLWGSKKKTVPDSQAAGGNWLVGAAGALGDSQRQAKFMKLMGAKGLQSQSASAAAVNQSVGQVAGGTTVFGTKSQQEYEQELEQQYSSGLVHNISRTGLGAT